MRAETDVLGRELESLRTSPRAGLLPDVEIYHKAVDWALRGRGFYRSNEVALARGLLSAAHLVERGWLEREGETYRLSSRGLQIREAAEVAR